MSVQMGVVTEKDILARLYTLNPERWFQVLDFIGYLNERTGQEPKQTFVQSLQPKQTRLWATRPPGDGWEAYTRAAERVRQVWSEEQATQDVLDEIRR